METLKGWDASVDFNNDLVGHLKKLRSGTYRGTRNNPAIFSNGSCFNNDNIQFVISFIFGIVAVQEILGEHRQVLVRESDATSIDALFDILADLMGIAAINHVQSGPTVFGFCTSRSADEKVELHLPLQIVFFNVVGESSRDHFGITNTSETRPAKISLKKD